VVDVDSGQRGAAALIASVLISITGGGDHGALPFTHSHPGLVVRALDL